MRLPEVIKQDIVAYWLHGLTVREIQKKIHERYNRKLSTSTIQWHIDKFRNGDDRFHQLLHDNTVKALLDRILSTPDEKERIKLLKAYLYDLAREIKLINAETIEFSEQDESSLKPNGEH